MNNITYAGKHAITHDVSQHSHNSLEMIYCTSGNGVLTFPDSKLHYQVGNIVVIPSNLPHINHSDTGFTNIHLNIQEATIHVRHPFIFSDDPNHFVLDAFKASLHHFHEAVRQENLLSAYGNLLVTYAGTYRESPFHSETVTEIVSSIIANYPDSNYELDKYLMSLPFSYDYLRKLFKNEVGITPHQYLMNLRLQNAAEWLMSVENKNNISEIARLCGFREPLYFSRMFKKKYGVSPTRYALENQEGPAAETEESIKIFPEEET